MVWRRNSTMSYRQKKFCPVKKHRNPWKLFLFPWFSTMAFLPVFPNQRTHCFPKERKVMYRNGLISWRRVLAQWGPTLKTTTTNCRYQENNTSYWIITVICLLASCTVKLLDVKLIKVSFNLIALLELWIRNSGGLRHRLTNYVIFKDTFKIN